ncbi:MAG: choline kinase [Myxococcota bacterium]
MQSLSREWFRARNSIQLRPSSTNTCKNKYELILVIGMIARANCQGSASYAHHPRCARVTRALTNERDPSGGQRKTMKAIIVGAGQGKRLLPHTADRPKCLLPVIGDLTILEVQLRALAECGVTEAAIMVGFRAEQVEKCLAERPIPGLKVRTCYNPFYAMSDNLATVWLARPEMTDEFLLINGDTLFEISLLEKVLAGPKVPITVTINEAEKYDEDDMKVLLDKDDRLTEIGKHLDINAVDAESIGMLLFRGKGVDILKDALDRAIRTSEGLTNWYLKVIGNIALEHPVETTRITGNWWGEVDCIEDLEHVRESLATIEQKHLAGI